VEDDNLVRESLAILIGGASGYQCVGAHASGEQALEKAESEQPQVVLMDINLPKMSGIECARALRTRLPEVQIIMLTMYEDEDTVFQALEAGATGYLLKRTAYSQILAAIEDVHNGGSPMTSTIARKVIQSVSRARVAVPPKPGGLAELSPRETEILTLLAKGFRYKEIAQTLGIKLETVRTHLRRIYEKLHVSSRTEAVVTLLGTSKTIPLMGDNASVAR
jgi:DNA-binding NarL/FixJ family response regulator